MLDSKILHLALRALQLIFAIIVMGVDGYAIHTYHGYNSIVNTPEGDFSVYTGVPNAWGFLMFCAAWTILVVIVQLVAANASKNGALVGNVCLAIDAVALLSWFAGWVAVAVNIGIEACPAGYSSCGTLKAATVFGAFEWLLFMITTTLAVSLFFNSKRQPRASAI